MKKTKMIKLIDSKFNLEDSKDVLMKLINYKIGFHEQHNFSCVERFGKPDEHSTRRIKELAETKESLLSFMNEIGNQQVSLKIDSTITIEIE